MNRLASGLSTVVVAGLLSLVPSGATTAVPAPTRSVVVSGTGVSTYPAFSPSIERYAVRTTGSTDGTLTVTASTSDPAGVVRVDGRPVGSGDPVDLTGLGPGDEVSVSITDSSGTSADSFIYLPAGFPALDVTTDAPGNAPGYVFLGLTSFFGTPYEAVVDEHGVPIFVRAGQGQDFKVQPDGHYWVARPTATPGRTGYQITGLDSAFRPTVSYETAAPLTDTDFHDSIVEPDGSHFLVAYQPSTGTSGPVLNAVIQKIDPQGNVAFSWNSGDHIEPTEAYVSPGGDYAHINSIQLTADGDLLASFRNLGQVLRIAVTAHGSYQSGDVVWRMGGARNQFTFLGDPYGGNCAQHSVTPLPNGHVLIFDNGSQADPTGPIGPQTADMCPDPDSPGGPRIARPQTRVTEYALDESAHTATLVWSYLVPHRYAAFAGSVQRLSNGDTMVGWSSSTDTTSAQSTQPIASEVDADKNVVWSVNAPGFFSYRAFKFAAPDSISPVVDAVAPAQGAAYVEGDRVLADYGCTDRGGSNLTGCSGPVAPGATVSTTPGVHSFDVVAVDGDGNTTTTRRSYTVAALHEPDGRVRSASGPWVGDETYGGWGTQRVTTTARRAGVTRRSYVAVQNDGRDTDRLRLKGTASGRGFTVAYFHGPTRITRGVVAGTFRTPALAPGRSYTLQVRLTRTRFARPGTQRVAAVRATSLGDPSRMDAVAATLRAVR